MKSGVVQVDGSGAIAVADWQHCWAGNDAEHHFSRHIFASFCDAIVSARDPKTGGAPQLVTIRRTKNGQYLGVVFNGSAFVKGLAIESEAEVSQLEFFNRNYERVALSGHLLANAQPQPRPETAPPPPKAR
ncbi:hypothetical protein J2797_005452 [Paraburkholderia terricola]|uniref:hypothetical protein n=1 Tax=Paraburkholderia terricola TaxID=169427 RepID=UPI0028633C3A|nr:hypothetical protein [Paraburkholderia terricola]MDR6495530.1 hypothetical protein [Paraburkholderia terricola]